MNMKKGLVFLFGVFVGVIITFIGAYIYATSNNTYSDNSVRNSPITWYEEPYETITFHNGVDVFQMLQDDYGLSRPKNHQDGFDIYLIHGEQIYDGKHIARNKFYIKGVYTYTDTQDRVRNVPVIESVN